MQLPETHHMQIGRSISQPYPSPPSEQYKNENAASNAVLPVVQIEYSIDDSSAKKTENQSKSSAAENMPSSLLPTTIENENHQKNNRTPQPKQNLNQTQKQQLRKMHSSEV
jgi:hypothetical protein